MHSALPDDVKRWLDDELHDLCQPLTALECRLCLSQIGTWPGVSTECEELRRVVEDGLRQVRRMMQQVRHMQEIAHVPECAGGAR